MILLAAISALACSAGYALLIRGSRDRLAALPLAVLGVLIVTSLALTSNIQESPRPSRELRLYFSLAERGVIDRVLSCRNTKAPPDCPVELARPAQQVVAVFSERAVADFANQPAFDSVRPLSGVAVGADYGLTVEAALDEIGREAPGGDTVYVMLTPRARSVAAVQSTYQKLLQEWPDLRDRIVFLGEGDIGIPRDQLVPHVSLDAPQAIGANGGEYSIEVSGENRTIGAIELDGIQLIGEKGGVTVHPLRITKETVDLPPAGVAVTSHSIAPDENFTIRGSFETAAMGSVTTHSIAVRNGYGETLRHLRAITRVEKPVIGVLRVGGGAGSGNDFLRFARASGVEVEEVLVDFDGLEDPAEREALMDATADELSLWGMLVVAEPLTAMQAGDLLEVLKRTPQSRTVPSLLFVGAGTSETLYSDLTDPVIAGWQTFLGPLGISDLSGARKVLIAVDQSGSLRNHRRAVSNAVQILYDTKFGLGARNANLLIAFCGKPIAEDQRICTQDRLKDQVQRIFDQNNWEGSEHLVTLLEYARQRGNLVEGIGEFTDVSDLILFWDGTDIGGLNGDRGDQYLSTKALRALPEILALNIKIHVATFESNLAEETLQGFEELSKFAQNETGERFRDQVVRSVIDHGLAVGVGTVDGLNDIARRRLLALQGGTTEVVNTLFGPNTLQAVRAAGAIVPLHVNHPSGFIAPLMALKDPVAFDTGTETPPLNLRIGYLGVDLASEFAAIGIDADLARQTKVGDVVYSAVDAMGAQLRAPSVSWLLDGDLVLAIRDNFLPFHVQKGIRAEIRGLESDGTPSATAPLQYLGWNELGLDRMGVDLAGAALDPGSFYEAGIQFCHFPTAQAAGECTSVTLSAPVVGAYPMPMSSSDIAALDAPEPDKYPPPENRFAISESFAKMAFAAMSIAVAMGVILL